MITFKNLVVGINTNLKVVVYEAFVNYVYNRCEAYVLWSVG